MAKEIVDGVTYGDNNQPRDLFTQATLDMLDKMGTKTFWDSETAQNIALEAYSLDYLRTDHTGFEDEDQLVLQVTINEFWKRKSYML